MKMLMVVLALALGGCASLCTYESCGDAQFSAGVPYQGAGGEGSAGDGASGDGGAGAGASGGNGGEGCSK